MGATLSTINKVSIDKEHAKCYLSETEFVYGRGSSCDGHVHHEKSQRTSVQYWESS